MGETAPTREQESDIEFGWPLLQQVVALGIGHAMAVRERDVIAVEASEGISAVIRRAGELCRARGWILLATAPGDGEPPLVDVEMIEQLAAAGGGALALDAGRVRLADRRAVIKAADRAKIPVVGLRDKGTEALRD